MSLFNDTMMYDMLKFKPFPGVPHLIVVGDPLTPLSRGQRMELAYVTNTLFAQQKETSMRPYEISVSKQQQVTKPLGYLKAGEFATIEKVVFDPFDRVAGNERLRKAINPFEDIFGGPFSDRSFGKDIVDKYPSKPTAEKWQRGDLVEAVKVDENTTVVINRTRPNAPIADVAAYATSVRLLDRNSTVTFTVNTGTNEQ